MSKEGKYKKLRISVLLLLTLMFLSVFPTSVSASSYNQVTEEEAVKAAGWHVLNDLTFDGESSEWHPANFTLSTSPIRVYDPAGTHVAYIVNVFNHNGEENGYILVSAFYEKDPILAWSYEDTFDIEKVTYEINKKNDYLSARQVVDIDPKVIWYGTPSFYLNYNINKGINVIVDSRGNLIEGDFSKLTLPRVYETFGEHNDQWELIKQLEFGAPGQTNPRDGVTTIDPETWESGYSSINRNYIHTPNQKQWYYTYIDGQGQATGCSPTAASNIMAYWASNGYSKLDPTRNQRDIVMALRTHMNTYQSSNGEGTTAPGDIARGLQSYASEKLGKGPLTIYSRNLNLAGFDSYKEQINAGRPALQSYWNQSYFGDHTVTVVGYKQFLNRLGGTTARYLVVKNNFINETHGNMYVKWGTWNTNVMTAFYPDGNLDW